MFVSHCIEFITLSWYVSSFDCVSFSKYTTAAEYSVCTLNIIVEWTLPPTVTLLENWLLFRSPHYSSNVEVVEVHCNHSISGMI